MVEKLTRDKALTVCELDEGGIWKTASIYYALSFAKRPRMRCLYCHGRLRAHREGDKGPPRAHFEHLKAHRGCRFSYIYDGKDAPHPDAVMKALSQRV